MASVSFHPYQREGIVRAYHAMQDPASRGGFYLQWKPGMGKTLGAIALHRQLRSTRTVIVCPVVAQGVWRREFEKWLPGTVISDDVTAEAQVVLTTYDKLKDPKATNVLHQRRTGAARLHRLQAWDPVLLILDEAQYIKGRTARTRAMWKLAAACQYKLLLSGTPAHSPLDWWTQFRVVAPHEPVFQQPFDQFKAATVVLQSAPNGGTYPLRGRGGQILVRNDGYGKLVEAMAPYVHAVSKDVLQLPEPIVTDVPITLGPKERKAYTQMETMLRAELTDDIGQITEANATIVLTKILRLTQIAAGHVTNEDGHSVDIGTSKLDAAMELLEEREDDKVVIATRFRQDIKKLSAALDDIKRPYKVIDGGTAAGARTRAEDWFQTEDHNGVVLINYRAGGVAITLTAATAMILYTLTPSVIDWEQTTSRIHRIGTTTNVQFLYLTAEQTQDEIMRIALQRGASAVDMARLLLRYLNRVDGVGDLVA